MNPIQIIIEYAGIIWGAIATIALLKQQISLLQQANELNKFKLEITDKFNLLDTSLDARFDANEKETLIADKDNQQRIAIAEEKIESLQNWIARAYNYLLYTAGDDKKDEIVIDK